LSSLKSSKLERALIVSRRGAYARLRRPRLNCTVRANQYALAAPNALFGIYLSFAEISKFPNKVMLVFRHQINKIDFARHHHHPNNVLVKQNV
ncbi:MAG: hypothetical protein PVH56_16445, partial [Desulfobacterales bacterium]